PGANGTAVTKAAANAAASPSPSPKPTASPSPTPQPRGKRGKPAPNPTPSGPRIDTKVAIFPLDAPAAPTPQPTGDTQSFAQRVPVMRVWMMSQTDIKIVSLAAAHFK